MVLNPPDFETEQLLQAAKRAFNARDIPGAKNLARQILLRRPADPTAHQILGVAALEANDFTAAHRHLERVANANQSPVVLNLLGLALRGLEEVEAAVQTFRRAGELGLIDGWRNLGAIETSRRNFDAAIAAYQRALAMAPNDSASHARLAHAYETGHDLARAKHHAHAALHGDPVNDTARVALARVLLREKDYAGAEAAAAPLAYAPQANPEHRVVALGVIGDARDRAGDAAGAFEAFSAANEISLSLHGHWLAAARYLYHPDGVRGMATFVASTDVDSWFRPARFTTPAPVFLIGFPRSGTTLLDQILSSHSGIVCLEERDHFSEALGAVFSEPGRLAQMDKLNEQEIVSIRNEYWRRVRANDAPEPGMLVIDKFPLNIVVLPLIKAVFPDAQVIFALRDPRDVVLSCYQQRFGMNAAMAQFLRLDTAGAYYDLVMSFYELCRARLGLDLHQVRYEDVVANLEDQARALAAFLGVAFEPAMLDFRATALARRIATPSSRQVTEPLYSHSVGRWRRYAEQLAPVLPQLNVWAQRFGYGV
jgi:tetratricopeptide (TPR) repeat protein